MWLPGLAPAQRLWIKAQLPFVFLCNLQSRHAFPGSPTFTLASQGWHGESRTFSIFMEKVGLLFAFVYLFFMFSVQLSKQPQMQAVPQYSLGPHVARLLAQPQFILSQQRVFFFFFHVKILLS